jgi:hypothetical protein
MQREFERRWNVLCIRFPTERERREQMTKQSQKFSYPIEDEHDFKGWRLTKPNPAKLLKEIVFRHRGASIRVAGKPGKWAVWPVAIWCEWTALSRDQVERALRILELDGLIRRERHRFGGTTVCAFIQPTVLALLYLGRPDEKQAAQAAMTGTGAPTSAGANAGTGAGTDYTSLSSSSTSSTFPKKAPSSLCEKGKGKGPHEGVLLSQKPASIAVAIVPKVVAHDPGVVGGDPVLLEKLKAIKQNHKLDKAGKREALLKLLPPITSASAAGVKHPSDMHAKSWHGWSPEMHVKRYGVYCEYAANALGKGVGKKHLLNASSAGAKLMPLDDPILDAEMAEMDAAFKLNMSKLDCIDESSVLP